MKSVKSRTTLGILILIGVVALIFGYKLYKHAKQKDEILRLLGDSFSGYSYVTSYEMDQNNDDIHGVTVYVDDGFNNLHYAEIEDFIHHVESNFSMAYLDVMIESMTREEMDNYQVSAKIVCDNTVYTYQVGSSILKDGVPFDRESFYCSAFSERYELEDADLEKLSKISDETLDDILAIKDVDERKSEINYQYGLAIFNAGDFSSAKLAFSDLANHNYKDTGRLLQESEIMERVQGTWKKVDEYNYLQIIFDGWKMCITDENILGSNNYKYKSETGIASIDNSNQIIFTPDSEYGIQKEFSLQENKLYQVYADLSLQNECVKVSEDTTFPDIVELVQPYIGMTAEEVRTKSTWGNPEDINTTITGDITYEQWCYPGFKYIYLENGIVTSIQK